MSMENVAKVKCDECGKVLDGDEAIESRGRLLCKTCVRKGLENSFPKARNLQELMNEGQKRYGLINTYAPRIGDLVYIKGGKKILFEVHQFGDEDTDVVLIKGNDGRIYKTKDSDLIPA